MQTPRKSVRVLCGRCQRKLDDYRGCVSRAWGKASTREEDGGKRYRCDRCRADYPVRGDKLTAAYHRAVTHPEVRQRVIRLPQDLRG